MLCASAVPFKSSGHLSAAYTCALCVMLPRLRCHASLARLSVSVTQTPSPAKQGTAADDQRDLGVGASVGVGACSADIRPAREGKETVGQCGPGGFGGVGVLVQHV
eukprot:351813-Chlamydomonas_euryale.AAC.3